MSQLVESADFHAFEDQQVSPILLLALWLFLGLITYGFAMFKIWAPQLTQSLSIII